MVNGERKYEKKHKYNISKPLTLEEIKQNDPQLYKRIINETGTLGSPTHQHKANK